MLILHTLVPSFSCWLLGGPETTTEDINFTKMSLGEEGGGGGCPKTSYIGIVCFTRLLITM